MKTKIIWALGLTSLAVFGLYIASVASGENIQTESVDTELSAEKTTYSFGEIDIFGGTVETNYTIRNTGDEPVTITSAITSCMCTEGEIQGMRFGMHGGDVHSVTIPAGSEEEVTAVFDPLAHGPNATGKITRELILRTNSNETPVVRLRFSADVTKG